MIISKCEYGVAKTMKDEIKFALAACGQALKGTKAHSLTKLGLLALGMC